MAHFYGRLQGNRGEATRCGSKDSGIDATAESWTSVVRVLMRNSYQSDRQDCGITVESKHGSPVLRLWLRTDDLIRHRADPNVVEAVAKIEDAFADCQKVLDEIEFAETMTEVN